MICREFTSLANPERAEAMGTAGVFHEVMLAEKPMNSSSAAAAAAEAEATTEAATATADTNETSLPK